MRAFVWDEADGAVELTTALRSAPNIDGWRFDTATVVSGDGRTIAGNGSQHGRQVAYVARLDALP